MEARRSYIRMTPPGFIKNLIMKIESGFQNTIPRRHDSVALRPDNPDGKHRSARPRTASTGDLEFLGVNNVLQTTAVTDGEDLPMQGNHKCSIQYNLGKGCGDIQTEDEQNSVSGISCPSDNISTEIGGIYKSYDSDPPPVLPQPLSSFTEAPMQCSFLAIPVELRFIIYNYALPSPQSTGEEEISIYYAHKKLRVIGPFHSQICRVNRQVYQETKKLLYGRTLVFLSCEALTKFSASRTSQVGSYIQSICMKQRVTNWVPAVKTLVLPPKASLTVQWPIDKELWDALLSNKTLQYRKVRLETEGCDKAVVFEPFKLENTASKVPNYEDLKLLSE